MELGLRFQLRYSYPQEGDSLNAANQRTLDDKDVSSFRIRRARLKMGGHAFQPWLKYYFEYDGRAIPCSTGEWISPNLSGQHSA